MFAHIFEKYGLLACPPTLDFLKGLAGRLRDEFPHDEKIWNAHHGKEEEGAGRDKRRHIRKKPWSELTDKVGADPEGKSSDGHCSDTSPRGGRKRRH